MTAYIHPKDHEQLNPFVLWDHFSAKAVMHSAGLDYHGHSGIDAISYPVIGKLNHRDSAGSHVTLASGDVHIMTSGKGIIHKDTLTPKNGQIEAFSLWTVLPAGSKEMAPACSTNIDAHHLPLVEEKCTITKVIIGHYKGANSPVQYSIPITYLDVMIAPYSCWSFQPDAAQSSGFIYLQSGTSYVSGNQIQAKQMATLQSSHLPIEIRTGKIATRLFVVVGQPLQQSFYSSVSSVHSSELNMTKATQNIENLLQAQK
ncbi:hypothetical protein C9I90_08135 [Photobacterium aphoticum]|uniref:Pirin n=1 Tax=Photobacterium aphoticum TaxID=754436 RepID=A0A0J1GU00_9GAMM|nr:pirin [Photobacterium aphoticum]PSU58045.1 hypothetical protein C9I90_08135 [Photobacterium aphoticum]